MGKAIRILLSAILVSISITGCRTEGLGTEEDSLGERLKIIKNTYEVMDQGPVKGGILRLFSTTPDTLNPVATRNKHVREFSCLVFESLVALGKDQKPVPVLSDWWEVSSDSLVWTFHVRENVFWHDGSPLTAEDVEFTIESILKSDDENLYKRNLQGVVTFAAVDRHTIKVALKKPNSFFAELMTFPIISKQYSEYVSGLWTIGKLKPVGTGPYKYESNEGNKTIRLVENDNWWNGDNDELDSKRLPYISQIEIKIYKSGNEEMAAFQSDQIDVAFIEDSDYEKYSGRSDLIIKKLTGRDFEFLAFNLKNPALAEKPVRKAIESSIDKNAIIDSLFQGRVTAADIPVIPGSWILDRVVPKDVYDPVRVREILENDGWKHEKGRWTKTLNWKKIPLDFEIIVNDDNDVRIKVAEQIAEYLREAGINARITLFKWEEMMERINKGKFDMAVLGCRIPVIPDISYLYSIQYNTPYLLPDINAARNISGYNNVEVADLVTRIFSEKSEETRKALFYNMYEIIRDDVPYIGLYFYNNAVLYNRNIRGELDPYIWNRFNNVSKWYIPVR